MQIFYIRHGQSENNLIWGNPNYRKIRKDEPLLTETGRQQARLVAARLAHHGDAAGQWDPYNVAGFGITHVYCSLMVRAIETATPIAAALGLPLYALPELHETGGVLRYDAALDEEVGAEGQNRSYFAEHYPHLYLPDSLGERGWWGSRPLESEAERLARGEAVLQSITAKHGEAGDRVALVSHGGFYNYLLNAIFHNMSASRQEWCFLLNTSISRIDYTPTRRSTWGLIYSNRCDHLPHALITH